ncbi:MAG: lipoyl(octanoyl) transferase LipB [Bdellovibrionales bacterium]|nr:lipoyl(octanoyl) transferase LipB [Bdellovibrionales bacterium]
MTQIAHGGEPDTLVFCSHHPIVTLGRSTPIRDWKHWQGPTMEVSRGGRATYHGPNQIVVYPLLNLNKKNRKKLRYHDVHQYIALLGFAVETALNKFNLQCQFLQGEDLDEDGNKRQRSGIWVGGKKLASLGIGVKKWVTFHGVAINVEPDPSGFSKINPCGFTPQTMISLGEILKNPPSRQEIRFELIRALNTELL